MAAMRHVSRLGYIGGASIVASRHATRLVQPWTGSVLLSPGTTAAGIRKASTTQAKAAQVSKDGWDDVGDVPPDSKLPDAGVVRKPFLRFSELATTHDEFARRHIGPDEESVAQMLKALSPPVESLDEFVEQVIPPDILTSRELFSKSPRRIHFGEAMYIPTRESHKEWEVQKMGELLAEKNDYNRKYFIGAGYYGTLVPEVIKRNVLENPAWYTSYTPYQPEISQGRLESLLNFQTLVSDMTGLPISNASLLDEGTAAAEAMTLSLNALPASRAKRPGRTYVVSNRVHPQTKSVLRSRAEGLGIRIAVMDLTRHDLSELEALGDDLIGAMVQYPDTYGQVWNFQKLADVVHEKGALLSAATDLLALTQLSPPGDWGADIAFGNSQRLGVPLGFGGPHAAFFAVKEKHKRKMPGRLIGVSKDRLGGRALRLSLQTREQHIRREKATSNVCTAQALLANMTAFYAVYHGPQGLRAIADRISLSARVLQSAANIYGWTTFKTVGAEHEIVPFDTVTIMCHNEAGLLYTWLNDKGIGVRYVNANMISISLDETMEEGDLYQLVDALRQIALRSGRISDEDGNNPQPSAKTVIRKLLHVHQAASWSSPDGLAHIPEGLRRKSKYLTHPVFNTHHSETELLRYIHHLQSKDLSLVHSMIPLGSCTMKLNGSAEMSLITHKGFANIHPFALPRQTQGYQLLTESLQLQLQDITGMDGVSLQPNSGAQGEFAGLRTIRKYLDGKGQSNRDICLIPVSAHGTNPASAAMAGMRVVPIKCDTKTGNLDLADLEAKCEKYSDEIAAMMITYPSTFGVFEPHIKKVCEIVHSHGGQVYMDGANMNAQIGLCSPGEIGADVCHLNLHKTFCIPHGGGGPGVGPICVKEHLVEYLPTRRVTKQDDPNFPVSSARDGSASILPISWAYNALMGAEGLKHATKVTLLNANYLLSQLKPHYPILYVNENGRCAHEFILDARPFHNSAGIEAIDIAKRLQDYGFHAPTMSWPVTNTLMIEPTESESKEELDRFVEALVSIRQEIREIEEGKAPREGNVLKMSPHPLSDIICGDGEAGGQWTRPYSREKAAYPLPWLKEKKFWPTIARVDDTYGDLNLFCTCPPVEDTTGGHLSSVQED
ncbi:glycine cleavage system P-protein-domain-containing protein [Lasiosphaeria ovina]|uniref:Glycine cleavage system P protein n=1 Tax=Lasiosphaeria ovina TaxID=92902 RepID=A0AAE0N1C5_9PEZI|nr:glycine cleavage system P-protein-domain-containing protein [Lasiosphaeria ovina]